jgi:uncharacterized protein YabE (DUF348 family)
MVSLYVDGQKRVINTQAKTVGDLLRDSNIKLDAGDMVEPTADTAIPNGFFNVNIYRARPIVVRDQGQVYQFSSAYQSAHLLAEQAGLQLYPEDAYDMSVVTNFVDPAGIGVQVTVKRAVPFTVHVDGQSKTIRTQAGTVGDALAGGGIKLGLKDTISVPLDSDLLANETVTITRVADVTATLTEPIAFSTQTIIDPTMLKGKTVVQTAGVTGARTAQWQIHYQNGVETHRSLLQLISQLDPVTQVIIVGTKVYYSGSVEYWRPQVEAAAAQWGLDPNMMLRIMSCESGGNANSISHFIVDGQHPEGLFQYLTTTWIGAGGTADNIFDGSLQIQLTAKKMATQGTGAWQCQ